jgi:hypothetical protein
MSLLNMDYGQLQESSIQNQQDNRYMMRHQHYQHMFLMHMLCNLLIEQWHRYQPDTALEPEFYQNTGGLLYRDYMMTVLYYPDNLHQNMLYKM